MEYVCPVCGAIIDQTATECTSCGEQFAINGGQEIDEIPGEVMPDEAGEGEFYEETTEYYEESLEVPEVPPEQDYQQTPEMVSETCPLCGGLRYSPESGDLVSCLDCGNVYTKKFPEGGAENSWKWKFWLGLVFILVGNFGFALASYIHNIFEWSPLGEPYLGYGWLDTTVGAVGVIIFLIGLILFAWSFKREREIQCPNCKIYMLESDLLEAPEEEDEEISLEGVMESIEEEILECPNCGADASIFDTECLNCGVAFEIIEMQEPIEEFVEEVPEVPEEEAGPLSEEDVILESLEYTEEEDAQEMVEEDNGTMAMLEEMEAELELDEDGHGECPGCGIMIEGDVTECPVCGIKINGNGGE